MNDVFACEDPIQSGGIPKAYAGKTLGDYITSEANRKAVEVAKWLIEYQD